MKTLAFTMWQNDLVGLDLWLKYYRPRFTDVYILSFGTRDMYFPELKKRNLNYSVHGGSLEEPGLANALLRETQAKFLEEYDWVLYANLDEFLIPDPKKYKSFEDLITDKKADWIASECFEVVQSENEHPIDFSQLYLRQRANWVKNPSMNKILLAKVPLTWNDGQHQINGIEGDQSKEFHDTGLYLIHIKHADPTPVEPREFGPMRRSWDNFVSDRMKDSKILIPEEFKDLI